MSSKMGRRAFLRGACSAALVGGAGAWSVGDNVPLGETGAGAAAAVHGSCDPWVEIDLKAIEFNIGQIRKKVEGRPILAVLKCNAYGHGLVGVAKRLERIPVEGIVVGKLGEAVALRDAGIGLPVLNLGPFSAEDAETIVRRGISQTVYTDAVLALGERAGKLGARASVHIKVDTGLGRVGVPHGAALDYIRAVARLAHIRVDGVFQSFTEDEETDRLQLRRFLDVTAGAKREGLPTGLLHAASSTAVFRYGPEYFLDAVRPGISIYGHYPTAEEHRLKRFELRPALSLKTRAAYVKTMKAGESVSYFRKFTAEKPERILTAALGYSDGVPQNLAGKATALVRGVPLPFIADVTASHSYLLATGRPDIATGDEVVIIGKQGSAEATLWDLAQAVGGSDYKILIGLSPSLHRKFVPDI